MRMVTASALSSIKGLTPYQKVKVADKMGCSLKEQQEKSDRENRSVGAGRRIPETVEKDLLDPPGSNRPGEGHLEHDPHEGKEEQERADDVY